MKFPWRILNEFDDLIHSLVNGLSLLRVDVGIKFLKDCPEYEIPVFNMAMNVQEVYRI